eukprot:scaffold23440_cov43-Phaeocystis_antarctica.AAC.1
MHRIPHPLCPGGSTPGPGTRAITSAPPRRARLALKCCPHVLGRGWRLPGSQETSVGSISTCSLRSSQWYYARLVSLLAWHPARESDVENQVPPPHVTPPFALIAAQPSAPAPPYMHMHMCRVQPKH